MLDKMILPVADMLENLIGNQGDNSGHFSYSYDDVTQILTLHYEASRHAPCAPTIAAFRLVGSGPMDVEGEDD